MDPQNVSQQEMERYVARFSELRGSGEAYIDTRLPGHRRFKINLIGMGVVEAAENPDLAPNIPLPAHSFNLGMIQAEHGNGAALHAHDTEEVFMPLVGRWVVTWLAGGEQREIELDPFDTISVPIGVYRGFRYVGEGTGTLLTLIGGPEAGKVHWHPDVVSAAAETGLSRDKAGLLETA